MGSGERFLGQYHTPAFFQIPSLTFVSRIISIPEQHSEITKWLFELLCVSLRRHLGAAGSSEKRAWELQSALRGLAHFVEVVPLCCPHIGRSHPLPRGEHIKRNQSI